MNKIFLLFNLCILLGVTSCQTPKGKVVFWTNYGTPGTGYWYNIEVKNQSSGTLSFENQKITVVSSTSAPGCSGQQGFVLELKPGTYLYTIYYGGSTGPSGTNTGSLNITEDGCISIPL